MPEPIVRHCVEYYMKKFIGDFRVATWLTTFALFIYTFLIAAEIRTALISVIFVLSPVLIIWMVITVLTDSFETDKTFDDYFYQDKEIRRTPVRDLHSSSKN